MLTAFSIVLGACIIALAIVFPDKIRRFAVDRPWGRPRDSKRQNEWLDSVNSKLTEMAEGGAKHGDLVLRLNPHWQFESRSPIKETTADQIGKREGIWEMSEGDVRVVFDESVSTWNFHVDDAGESDREITKDA